MRKISLVLLGAVCGAAVVGIGAETRLTPSSPAIAAPADVYRDLNLFGDVFEKIRTDYVQKPNDKKMIQAAISGMLSSLDPHSSYMDAQSWKDMETQTKGSFGGLGIEVTEDKGYVKVVSPIDDTPAAHAGILSGDLISAIDGASVKGMTLDQAVHKMRGDIGTKVKLTILRGPNKEKKEFTLTRSVIKIASVHSHLEKPDVGYIRISQFNETTYSGLKKAIDKIQKEVPEDKLKGYILDLRNNPGGLLDQAVEVANVFIKHGEIVSTRGRTPDETSRYDARPGVDISEGKPLVVLINGGSASASEIVAGALKDHKRATLIGTRSFGKGSVQTIIPLGVGNGALRLTTARYYTPSGGSIQAQGIQPDIVVLEDVPAALRGKDDIKGEASLKGHLKNGKHEEFGSQAYVPKNPAKDKALHAALDLLRGVKTAEALKAEYAADAASKSESDATPLPENHKPPVVIPPVGSQTQPVLKPGPSTGKPN